MDQEQLKNKLTAFAKQNANPEVSYLAIFSAKFMQKYTDYADINYFLAGLKIKQFPEINQLDSKKLDLFVKQHSHFKTWAEMQQAAVNFYMSNLL